MAIVSNWADPLKESILKLLSKPVTSYHKFEEIRRSAELLNGTDAWTEIQHALSRQMAGFEQRYQAALKLLESDSILTVQSGKIDLEQLDGYKDAAARIAEARERISDLEQAEVKRAERSRKRTRRIVLAASLVAVLLVAGLVLNASIQHQSGLKLIADAQSLVDAGQYDEAVEAVIALAEDGKTGTAYPELYVVSETILERTASDEGFPAAFRLCDQLIDSAPDAISSRTFYDYAKSQLEGEALSLSGKWELLLLLQERGAAVDSPEEIAEAYLASLPAEEAGGAALLAVENGWLHNAGSLVNGYVSRSIQALPAEEAWTLARRASVQEVIDPDSRVLADTFEAYAQCVSADVAWEALRTLEDENLLSSLSQETISTTAGNYLRFSAEELTSGARRDAAAWAQEQHSWMKTFLPDPDAALQTVYALDGAGYDVAALFPDGIPVYIPVATRICNTTRALSNDVWTRNSPAMTSVLPISITESSDVINNTSTSYRYLPMFPGLASGHDELDRFIEEDQSDDANYDVRLLPDVLMQLPENVRPATYAQCSSLLCLQSTYFYVGVVEKTTQSSFGYTDDVTSKTYYPYFSALDLVLVYDPKDENAFNCPWCHVNPAQVEDEAWFRANKDNNLLVTSIDNRLGSFDRDAASQAYDDYIDATLRSASTGSLLTDFLKRVI